MQKDKQVDALENCFPLDSFYVKSRAYTDKHVFSCSKTKTVIKFSNYRKTTCKYMYDYVATTTCSFESIYVCVFVFLCKRFYNRLIICRRYLPLKEYFALMLVTVCLRVCVFVFLYMTL